MSYRPKNLIIQVQTISGTKGEGWELEVTLHGKQHHAKPHGAAVTRALFFKDADLKFPFATNGVIHFCLKKHHSVEAEGKFDLESLAGDTSPSIEKSLPLGWTHETHLGNPKAKVAFAITLDPPLPDACSHSVWRPFDDDENFQTAHPENLLFINQSIKPPQPLAAASIWAGMIDESMAGAPPPLHKRQQQHYTIPAARQLNEESFEDDTRPYQQYPIYPRPPLNAMPPPPSPAYNDAIPPPAYHNDHQRFGGDYAPETTIHDTEHTRHSRNWVPDINSKGGTGFLQKLPFFRARTSDKERDKAIKDAMSLNEVDPRLRPESVQNIARRRG